MSDFNTFPLLSGIYNFSTKDYNFNLLCVRNDDASVVNYFWKGEYKNIVDLDLWADITKNKGIYIDVGSHTGLFTIVGLKSNKDNHLISIEPSYINMGRMLSNLRLNDLLKNHSSILCACSDKTMNGKFLGHHDPTFMSKGGKIADEGTPIHIISLDSIQFQDIKNIKGIKIDTEGEDYKVLKGAKNIIKSSLPEIIIEVREENKKMIHDFLYEYGYKFYIILDTVNNIDLLDLEITTNQSVNIYATVNSRF